MSVLPVFSLLPRHVSIHRRCSSLFYSFKKLFHTTLAARRYESPSQREFRNLVQYAGTAVKDGDSVFEDTTTEEYESSYSVLDSAGHIRGGHQQAVWMPSRPCLPLRKLIREGRLQEADAVFQELREADVPFIPSYLYLKMARFIVDRAVTTSPDASDTDANRPSRRDTLADDLEAWLSLIPERLSLPILAHPFETKPVSLEVSRLLQVHHLGHYLMRFSRVPASAVARYATVVARKGYGRDLHSALTKHLARFLTSNDDLVHFLDEFSAQVDAHAREHPNAMRARAPAQIRQTMWSIAIRGRCLAGRLDDAKELLHRAVASGVRPTEYAFRFLYGALLHHDDQEGATELHALFPAFSGPLEPAKLLLVPQPPLPRRRLAFSDTYALRINFGIAQHILRRGEDSDGIPRARALVPFFDIVSVQADKPENTIRTLYARAWSIGGAHRLGILVHAHMLHYVAKGRSDLVLRLFARFFHPVGVSDELLRARIAGELGRTTQLVTPDKLVPSAQVAALVWGALARSSQSRAQFASAYEHLKQAVAESGRRMSGKLTHVDGAIGAEAFHQFLLPRRAVMLEPTAREHALLVYADMCALGVEPNPRTHVLLAKTAVYARRMERARAHFDDALALCEEKLAQAVRDGNRPGQIRWEAERVKVCAVIVKVLVREGFVGDARSVWDRMEEQFAYVAGQDAGVDSALRDLKHAESGVSASEGRDGGDERR